MKLLSTIWINYGIQNLKLSACLCLFVAHLSLVKGHLPTLTLWEP